MDSGATQHGKAKLAHYWKPNQQWFGLEVPDPNADPVPSLLLCESGSFHLQAKHQEKP
jgi:hypothetical protein